MYIANTLDGRSLETAQSSIQSYVAELTGDDAATFSRLMGIAGKVELALSRSSHERFGASEVKPLNRPGVHAAPNTLDGG